MHEAAAVGCSTAASSLLAVAGCDLALTATQAPLNCLADPMPAATPAHCWVARAHAMSEYPLYYCRGTLLHHCYLTVAGPAAAAAVYPSLSECARPGSAAAGLHLGSPIHPARPPVHLGPECRQTPMTTRMTSSNHMMCKCHHLHGVQLHLLMGFLTAAIQPSLQLQALGHSPQHNALT